MVRLVLKVISAPTTPKTVASNFASAPTSPPTSATSPTSLTSASRSGNGVNDVGPALASTELEKSAFLMYLTQLQAQVAATERAVECLEKLGVDGEVDLEEAIGGLEGEGTVREWIRDVLADIPKDQDGKLNYVAWRERAKSERAILRQGLREAGIWSDERIERIEGGVRAAEAKLNRLIERGTLERELWVKLGSEAQEGVDVGSAVESGLLGRQGWGARRVVVECKEEMCRLRGRCAGMVDKFYG
ncbi:hypothetical protein BDZ91DRAFT_722571 [Kalaharituber pfeilii]|nr:hypothetical protein BDZ91DRAFT_722571 [Kalaharituber pfeilii]